MAKHAKRGAGVCQEMRSISEVSPNIHQPGGVLNPFSSSWPFAQWGLDIMGPFPKAVENKNTSWSVHIILLSG